MYTSLASRLLYIVLLLSCQLGLKALSPSPNTNYSDTVYFFVDQRAIFPGGDEAMNKYIAQSLRYPPEAREQKIEGRVLVRFVVDRNGFVKRPTVLNQPHKLLAEEAVRVVSKLPNWLPAQHQGKAVSYYVTVPINFKL